MTQASLFDQPTGEDLRDRALEQVAQPTFMDAALLWLARYARGAEVTGEAVRLALTDAGITPHHHNAWGALLNLAARKHVITKTGTYQPMRDPRSHARMTPVYRVL